ncbi:LPS export ABC transporter permease LptG [Phyllobacterium endophyticum]|uniref:LPS export ABC transporter permease LptG n=1 Tax=Phyllobacterium endophyticum TaxID=1149773 RepID=A0A2P7AWK4_9HYPH|nr:LPS export ABC transporter permease LptG [Phyllobacterium endophyticum]MBB3235223.1 lipopolysaccharide export system permease protein [Phyllobacterium endophyticum]PSH58597.1 LPS export ABC transporter permease LptG [Phyllobacterium endophyticum]TXR49059.1 LPS export ABC transporter permease LptG [Phyllobacterium endophyticum]TYR39281.1 LPS export ABC transporter permease LptG [Phyllobacterium endophyticum]
MIGWTLGRYFFLRYVTITCYFLMGSFALSLILDFTEQSGRLSALPDYSAIQAFGLSAMRVPYIMQQVFPFIALFAAMATLISLNRKYELVVARSVGVSAWQFLLPACAGALLFGLVAVLAVNPLAAWGFERSEQITANWRAGKANDVSADRVPWLRQKTDEGDTIIGSKSVVNRGLRLVDAVFIRLDKNQDVIERYDAKTADLEDGFWRLNQATKFVLGERPVSEETVRIPTRLRPEFVEESLAAPETIPFFELRNKIAAARSFGYSANAFDMHFQSLLALPALLMAMTLIAATVSLKFVRFGQSGAMILGGVLAGFVLYVVTVVVKAFGNAGFVPPFVAAWTPVLIATFFGVSFLLHKEDG